MPPKEQISIPTEIIENKIYFIRGQKVMMDFHLAELYETETKILKRAVRRNIDRFPEDFMFEINRDEYNSLRYHFGTLKRGAHTKYLPYAFTEQGISMLSSVLNSDRAIQVNIAIMRSFVRLRKMLASHKDLERKLYDLEKKYDKQFKVVFDAIRALMKEDEKPKREIGFRVKERLMKYRRKKNIK